MVHKKNTIDEENPQSSIRITNEVDARQTNNIKAYCGYLKSGC